MVSVNVISKVLSVIDKLSLDKQSISDISEINQVEIENALNVLISHGYVLKSTSKSLHKGKKYKTNYYKASESAIEILNKGGFTKQLSMKENTKTSIKNKLSIKDSTVNQINQGSFLKDNNIILKQTKTPSENENKQSAITKSIGKWFWLFVIPLVIGIVLIAIQFKWFK